MARSRDVRDLDAYSVASQIRAMLDGDSLTIADIRIPGITTPCAVVIRYNETRHIHHSHPELKSQESLIVDTVRAPDHIFRDPRYADTYSVARQITEKHDLFMSLEFQQSWLRVKSARIHRHNRTQRLLERAVALSESGGSGDEE